MRIVKVKTVSYDPKSSTLTFSGLNRFSRPKEASIPIDDDVKFIEIIHQLLANTEHSSVDTAAEPKSPSKKKKTALLQQPKGTRKLTQSSL
ncbi:hypothetical protein [Brucella anthropi]|jgi:hypothetical protein|uniref:hypothetical protein n=1 Tax=Brucella anthropi TaxID=529 RepID=UPI00241EABCE|nr:hypothetical protein [Brucella anthropi]MDG9793144.1 hypothetical protein [Brucella anthropi]MDH0582994.1 hypothetical protein [Brucella anthropi]MDH0819610.1 hypothetical protein [Brucella anthropi]MDH2086252.1 hypothetical protein [Brucella anthropi]